MVVARSGINGRLLAAVRCLGILFPRGGMCSCIVATAEVARSIGRMRSLEETAERLKALLRREGVSAQERSVRGGGRPVWEVLSAVREVRSLTRPATEVALSASVKSPEVELRVEVGHDGQREARTDGHGRGKVLRSNEDVGECEISARCLRKCSKAKSADGCAGEACREAKPQARIAPRPSRDGQMDDGPGQRGKVATRVKRYASARAHVGNAVGSAKRVGQLGTVASKRAQAQKGRRAVTVQCERNASAVQKRAQTQRSVCAAIAKCVEGSNEAKMTRKDRRTSPSRRKSNCPSWRQGVSVFQQ